MSTLVVTDMPIKSGHHLNILQQVFKSLGEDNITMTSVFPHMPEKSLKKMKAEQYLPHSERILKESEKYDRILCCGGYAPATVFKSDHTLPITRVRGRGFMSPSQKYTVCTFNPSTVVKDTDFFRDLVFDVEKLLTNNAPLPSPEIDIQLVEYKKDLKLLRDLHGASFLGCDTETTTFNAIDADILGIGFAAQTEENEGYVVVIPEDLIGPEVEKFLRTYKGTFIFHNLYFDIQHIWKKWGHFRFHRVVDTMLMNWCLDERPFNRYRSHGLKLLSRLYFDSPEYDIHMGKWLAEYFRVDVGEKERRAWVETFCEEHAEMARTAWRQWHEEHHGEQPNWRGRKVGRDISVEEVYDAVVNIRMPDLMRPPPSDDRKAKMWDDMMKYMGLDCFYTASLYPILRDKMLDESPRLWHLHDKYLIPACYALAQMKMTGARIDLPYMKGMKGEIETELAVEMDDLRKLVQKHTAHPKGEEFNPNSPQQVQEVLYDKEKGLGLKMPKGVGRYAYKREEEKLTTNSDTLKVLARQVAKQRPAISDLINLVLKYRVKSKILGTYIDGILERVDRDGRIRGDTNLHGTATARTSASNPNLQNIPDASHVGFDIRRAYVPTPGWVLLEADYSQLELRVAALFSQDEVLLDVYRQGGDIHQEVAYMLWQKPKEQITKYERYLAKCMNFGVLYGRGWQSIATGPEMDNLVEMSGRSWGKQEIANYFSKFKDGYVDLFSWMDLVKKDSLQKQYVENPLGHRRRFDLILNSERGHIERQAVNTPIQGFAAQITINALIRLNDKFDPTKQRILFTVHDSIMVECKKSVLKSTAHLIKNTMETELPEDVYMSLPALKHSPHQMGDPLVFNLPFVADVVSGPNWGEAHDEVTESPAVVEDDDEVLVA